MTEEIKRLTPTKETLIRLFAKSGNQCAFPNCSHEVFSEETLVAQVCHIRSAQKGGERFDASMNNEERRGLENLIILCHKHHKITNDVNLYPVSTLVEMKKNHEAKQNQELTLKDYQLVSIVSEIEAELSFKMDLIINKISTISDRLDFYGRNKLNRGNCPEEEDFNLFFNKFLDDNVDVAALLLKAQPTLKDCKKVFTEEYYNDVYYYYGILYRDLLTNPVENERFLNALENKYTFQWHTHTYDSLEKRFVSRSSNHISRLLNKSVKLYDIHFQEKVNMSGFGLLFWAFLDGRWVFFPKPNRAIREIDSLRNNEGVKYISRFIKRIIKWRLLPKDFIEFTEDEASVAARQVMRHLRNEG